MTAELAEHIYMLKEFANNNMFVTIMCFIVLQTISSIFFLPCSYIPILCGSFLGISLGGVTAVMATSLGTNFTFYIGRYARQSFFFKKIRNNKKLKPYFEKSLPNLTSKWRHILLFYFNPLLPGSSMGYFFGIGRTNKIGFFYKTFISSLPGCFLLAGFGAGLVDQITYDETSVMLKIFMTLFLIFIVSIKLYKLIFKKTI